ncbi:MAG: DMT family transporter [Oscillospiraceae bacterium]
MEKRQVQGHFLAVFTVVVWGATFISTKVLLRSFTPVEILFIRFIIAFVALFVAHPPFMKGTTWKQELLFAGAGLSGITLYYLMENIALTYTQASNAAVIAAAAPMFTMLLMRIFYKEKLKATFFVGFIAAMGGILLISLNGAANLNLNPMGDLLVLIAAICWGVYSVIIKKIGSFGFNTIQVTRRTFLYGIIFMIPALFLMDFNPTVKNLVMPVNLVNFLFLGLCAGALCFVTWNLSVKYLGAVKTSIYIYLIPLITVIMGVILLDERFTWQTALGTLLTLLGLVLSDGGFLKKRSRAK